MTRPRHRAEGFTLLETLLAIGLIGAILAVAISLLGDVSAARDRIERRLRQAEGATLAIDLLADRVATATLTAVDGSVGLVGDASSLRVTGGGVSSIRLAPSVRRSPLLDRSTLELAWRDGGLALRDDGAAWSLVAPDLVAIRFRFHDGEDWRETWDGGRDGLPTAIEIAIWETPWPEGLTPPWMPEPAFDEEAPFDDVFDDEFDAFDLGDLDALETFSTSLPAAEDEIPEPDRHRIVAILDPVRMVSSVENDETEAAP